MLHGITMRQMQRSASALITFLLTVSSFRQPLTKFSPAYRWHAHHLQRPPSCRSSNHGDFNRVDPTLAPLSSTQLVTEVTERLRIQQSSSTKLKRPPRSKPPLIDSDLLRFLKTTQSQYNNDNHCYGNLNYLSNSTENEPTAMIATDIGRISDAIASLVDSASRATVGVAPDEVQNDFNNDTFISSEKQRQQYFLQTDDDAMMQQWLKQYECTYIASLLQDKGANMEVAYAVGMVIERMSIVRAAQKRLRSYFKERNQIWNVNHSVGSNIVGNADDDKNNNMDDESTKSIITTASYTDGDILPFSTDCNNHNNMDQIIEVMLEFGLSTKDICEILISSPSLAFMQPRPITSNAVDYDVVINRRHTATPGRSLQEILDRVFLGLLMGRNQPHELKLRKYDARKVLRNTPGILTVRGSESAVQMIQLLSNLGVSSNSLSRDKNNLPQLLSRQPNAVFRLVAFLSSDAVRMPIHKIGPLLRRSECQDLLNAIAPSSTIAPPRISSKQELYPNQLNNLYTDCMSSSKSKFLSATGVAAQVQKAVVNNIYRRMSETAWTLRNKIGTQDLGRVIAAYPSVLLLDAARQILPTAHFLMDELAILPDDLPSVLQLYPALLRTDVEQMRNVVAYLTSLEVAQDNLGIIVRSFPVLLTLDIEHDMEPVVEFLHSIGVSNVGRFVSRLPPILGYSVENELRPKYEYLASISSDARFKITKFPAYFSYPLERVIKSRFEYLRNVKRIPTPLLSLDHILCSGDKDFAIKVARDSDVTQYTRFMEDRQKAHKINGNNFGIYEGEESIESMGQQQNGKTQSQSSNPNTPISQEMPKQCNSPSSSACATLKQHHQSTFPPSAAAITS